VSYPVVMKLLLRSGRIRNPANGSHGELSAADCLPANDSARVSQEEFEEGVSHSSIVKLGWCASEYLAGTRNGER